MASISLRTCPGTVYEFAKVHLQLYECKFEISSDNINKEDKQEA